MPKPFVELENLGKQYEQRWAVRGVTLHVERGETLVLIGASGSGKTTTLRAINRLVEPTEGRVRIDDRDVAEHDAAELRRGIGYVIQEIGLFSHYTVRRNVGVVPELLGWQRTRIDERVDELLQLLGLPTAEFAERYPHELSGGQRQRVGIARALAADPELVLLDEPFAALDPVTREAVQDEFLELGRKLRKTFVLVTHDVFEAVRLGTRIAVFHEGKLIRVATPAELVNAPASEVVVGLLGRHRYQLRLMTTSLVTAFERSGPAAAGAAQLDVSDSVWDALHALETSDLGCVTVRRGEELRQLDRATLLTSLEAS